PLSGVCGRADIMDAPAPGGLGGTYAGNPLAIASALEVIKIMEADQLPQRGTALGDRLQKHLKKLAPTIPEIAEVRGIGAMVAVEFRNPTTRAPDAELTRAVLSR